MTDIVSELRKLGRDNPTDDPEVLVRSRLASWTIQDLVPVLAREVASGQRDSVKTAELDVFQDMFTAPATPIDTVSMSATADPLSAFKSLFGKQIKIGNGDRVLFEDVTRDQWVARLAMLDKNIAALQKDRAIAISAIDLIDQNGVTTLGQI